ncbi:MAG: serine hydroxymethyltransferase [Candidatus Levybacteria bacterium]|nr:serine hydroxymethyltransferase [Candidatus Levybacteria bacterium]
MKHLRQDDPQIYQLVKREEKRQKTGIELIPSENYTSLPVMEAMGSILTNKYSEGYPKKRYYGGNEFIDTIEIVAQERAKKLFGVVSANVQPYSGSPANFAVYMATLKPGDTFMGQALTAGGHLTHGAAVSATAIYHRSVQYGVKRSLPDLFDYDEIRRLAMEYKPKLIWVGGTAHPLAFHYEKFAKIADEVGAYLAADIAHVAGLIAAGAHPSPVAHVHIITTTTHKTLRGPRGGMIMVTEKGVKKDKDLTAKIDKAIFPGLQGGPHDHQTAAIAVALLEASSNSFKKYAHQIVANAVELAESLKKEGFTLIGNRTENHLILVDLSPILGPGGGIFAQTALDLAHITLNKNTIPDEPASPFYPSGVRLGTPAITTRGMKEKDMKRIAAWIKRVIDEVKNEKLPTEKEERTTYLRGFRERVVKNKNLLKIAKEVKNFSLTFPVPGIA